MTQQTVHGHASALFDSRSRALPPSTMRGVIDIGGATREPTVEVAPDAYALPVPTAQPVAALPANTSTDADATMILPSRRGWTELARFGLKPTPPVHARAQRVAVSAYRMIGFGVLTMIVAALLGYVTLTIFYMLSTSWATPIALGPTDEKVVTAVANLAAQRNARDRSAAELAETTRAIAAHNDYQAQLARSIETDLTSRRQSLENTRSLARNASAARERLTSTGGVFAADHNGRVTAQYNAGLIDNSTLLAEKYQLAQISSSNVALAQKQGELEQRALELSRQAAGLRAVLSDTTAISALPYDVLAIKRELDSSKRELQNAIERKLLLETEVARQDAMIRGLEQSPYLRASVHPATVALVPYDNLARARPGAAVTSCRIAMIACRQIGVVGAVLPGEVTMRHPHQDKQLRGQMVELDLEDPSAPAGGVVFLGGAPLLF